MTKDWKNWCRLCARENGNEISVFIKNENATSIAEAIQSYFSVSILNTDIIPTKICNICNDIVMGLINFTIRSTRAQQLFNELQFNQNTEFVDLDEIRIKYGLTNQMYELKYLQDYHNAEKQEESMQINKVSRGRFLDDIDEFFKCDNSSNFSTDNEVESDNFGVISDRSEDEECLIKLNIKKEVLSERKRAKRRKINILPEDVVQSKLLERSPHNKSEDSVDKNLFDKEIEDDNDDPIKNEVECYSPKEKRRRNESSITCEMCNCNFNTRGKYDNHMKVKHNIVEAKFLFCKICGKKFKKQSILEDHENMHLPLEERKWYSCQQCDRKFNVKTSLHLHVKNVHAHKKTFLCDECGKAFVKGSHLNAHKVVHSVFTPFQCPKCPKTFKRLQALKYHINQIDCDAAEYICPICGCHQNNQSNLNKHMFVHSDVKYKCRFCPKEFKRRKNLKKHLTTHTLSPSCD